MKSFTIPRDNDFLLDVKAYEPLDYKTFRNYSHLEDEDAMLWSSFIEDHPLAYIKCYYDFPVGPGKTLALPMINEYSQMFYHLTRPRVDVIAESSLYLDIIELKQVGNRYAVGQILEYAGLFKRFCNPIKPVRPFLICKYIKKALLLSCSSIRVNVIVNPAPEIWDVYIAKPSYL